MIVEHIGDDDIQKKILIKVNWPLRIVYSQKLDSEKFGATFYDLPCFTNKFVDTSSIWVICVCLSE